MNYLLTGCADKNKTKQMSLSSRDGIGGAVRQLISKKKGSSTPKIVGGGGQTFDIVIWDRERHLIL